MPEKLKDMSVVEMIEESPVLNDYRYYWHNKNLKRGEASRVGGTVHEYLHMT